MGSASPSAVFARYHFCELSCTLIDGDINDDNGQYSIHMNERSDKFGRSKDITSQAFFQMHVTTKLGKVVATDNILNDLFLTIFLK